MSICKIGETKVINGKRYRKEAAYKSCEGCHYEYERCPGSDIESSIEEGGSECDGTIWILADDQPEAPTDTPLRDELREQRRLQAAVAAMQGMLSSERPLPKTREMLAAICFDYADAIIAELDKPETER